MIDSAFVRRDIVVIKKEAFLYCLSDQVGQYCQEGKKIYRARRQVRTYIA